MQLKQLKVDVKNWEKRCVNKKLGSVKEIQQYLNERQRSSAETRRYFNERRGDNNSPGCLAEKEYLRVRMRIHSKMCFYDGKIIS